MQIVINIPDKKLLKAFTAAAKQFDCAVKPDLLTNPKFLKELKRDVNSYLTSDLEEFFFNGLSNDVYIDFTEDENDE